MRSPGPSAELSRTLEDAPYPSSVQGWSAVFVLSLLYLLSMMDRNLMALLADAVGRDLRLGDVELGLLYGAAFAVLYSVAGLPLGWAIDRYPRRFVIWLGVVGWSLATTYCGLSRNFFELFASRAGVGIGEAALVPGSQSIIADLFPPSRLALPMSVYGLGNKVGGGLSFIIGGALTVLFPAAASFHILGLGEMKGWQMVFIVAGLPGLLISFIMFAIPEPERRRRSSGEETAKTTFGDYGRFIKKNFRFSFGYHTGSITTMMVSTSISTWTPTYFARVHGWGTDRIGSLLGIAMLVGPLIGIPLHGHFADRLFRAGRSDAHLHYFKVVLLMAIAPAMLVYVVPNPWMALALVALSQGLFAAYLGLLSTSLQLMVPGDLRGKAASVALLIVGIGGMSLGPPLIGFLTDYVFGDRQKIGLSMAVSIGLLLPLTIAILSLAQKPMREHLSVVASRPDAGASHG